ncbi:IS110 family transposase [Streptomyces sp. NBC_01264]|uniref:IS110 family transposase n=1 Tax=Streptomyces sp. NBC_01264 TaxID=2903804 RepID=UPI002252138D|nr:IS110 family transposase [Streptomyces sp. NBC_01264]MCX4776159.1 IS110 family transposase [Streptomyces sp. NBC_01264]MCX4776219.1 IS110 family transposase [Streptomyces sp. NBC_01264]MCX4776228.1 IS110 family transposase [Streptomyces sp. NBC_01264]MCX4776714.1 IS110 family transposase [Streptomyces sp. NBC_01264]MCX4776858.1 IS110 family transposase [Streptomyces sp. NBC_01264]
MLLIGDDWAEDHHDVEVQDGTGRKLAVATLPEGVEGIAKLHALIAKYGGADVDSAEVVVGIETDRGPWVQALIASGYQVFAINPRQVNRFKERYGTSGAKSDKGDAHALADMVRIDRDQLRPVAGDSEQAQAVKVVARAHQTLIWERTRTFQRLRNTLREYFPAALDAYADLALTSTDALELLIKAPTPATAAKLTRPQITAVLTRHRRHNRPQKAATIQTALREEHLGLPEPVTAAYAAAATAHARLLISLNEQIAELERQVKAHFLEHPDAEIYLSMPGIAEITGARVLAEFGDDPTRYDNAKARKNYAGTSPITRASGKSHTVQARYVRNNRLASALQLQAFSALNTSPGARRYYDKQRARDAGYNPALRQVGNRLVGILHGCLKTRTHYDEATAWSHHAQLYPS